MSWWNTSGFGDLATKALKNAQKQIDKVLDIDGGEESNESSSESKVIAENESLPVSTEKNEQTKTDDNTLNSLLGSFTDTKSELNTRSSWSLPSWGNLSTDESSTSIIGQKSTHLTSSKLSGKSLLKKTSVSKVTSEQGSKSKRSSYLSIDSQQTKVKKDENKSEQIKAVESKPVQSEGDKTVEVTEIKPDVLSDNSGRKDLQENVQMEASERLTEFSNEKNESYLSEKEILTSKNEEENLNEITKSVSEEDNFSKLTDSVDIPEQVCSESSKKSFSEEKIKHISESVPADTSTREINLDIFDEKQQKITVESVDRLKTSANATDLDSVKSVKTKSEEESFPKSELLAELTELPMALSELPSKQVSDEGNSNESLIEQVSKSASVPSANSEKSIEALVISQVDCKTSYSSDLGQSGWTSDVSWDSLGDTKLPGDSQEISATSLSLVSIADESMDGSYVNKQSGMDTETLELNQEGQTKLSEQENVEVIHQGLSTSVEDNDKTLDTKHILNMESNLEKVSEEQVPDESNGKSNLKPQEVSQASSSESSASLELIEPSDIINEAEKYKQAIQEQGKYENVDLLNSESVSSVLDLQSMEEDTELKETDQRSEKQREMDDTDPVQAYISEVVSQDLPVSPSAASSLGGTDSDNSKLDSSMDTYTSEDTVIERDKQEEEGEEVVDEEEVNDNSASSGSPSSSFVKCMLEDAMEDGSKTEDNGSDSHSTGGEKSECSRSTGGHESGDEIDTTTSSDIEIISTPTSNGTDKIIDLSPLKIALQKTAKKGSLTHRRSDSQSSSSTQSREGHVEQLSPGRDHSLDRHEGEMDTHYYGEAVDLPPLSEETNNDPYSPQKLLKLQTVPEHAAFVMQSDNTVVPLDNTDVDSMIKKLAEMSEILQARENKLVQLSRENNDLLEANSILRNQLQQSEEARESEMEDLNNLTAEFSERMGESEKKIQSVLREKETMKKQLQQAQEEFGKKDANVSNMLREKDQQISELLQEGEKLSKQQLQTNNIIKKLRVKEKESDSLITTQKKKLEEQNAELEHLKKVLDSKEEMEKKQTDAISQLNAAVQKQERDMAKYKSEYEDNQERIRGLQAALDNSYKEIAELNKSNAAQDSKAQETALSVEMHVREELKLMVEREQFKHKHEKEAILMQMEDLRLTMSRMEKEHNRREDLLRQEISDLQMQLQEDEARNQELTQSVTSATRPLLRQIENLQSTYTAQSSSWEKIEKNLADRLIETQTQLANTIEKERSASEKLMELTTKITSLESQNTHLKQDKSQRTAELEIIKAKVEVLEDSKNNEKAQIEAIKHQMSQEMSQIKKEKVFVETQLDMEKTKLDQEKKKLAIAHEQITQLEREVQRGMSRGTPSPISVSRAESLSSEPPLFSSLTPEDLERSFFLANPSTGGTKTSLYESLRQSGAANLLENLQSQLKLREGEIIQLQSDIQQLERTRESMARELVNLSNQNDELQEKVKELPEMIEKYKELDQRNNALLQMYGEKVEEANELRLDLEDVKDMYKTQINQLLAK